MASADQDRMTFQLDALACRRGGRLLFSGLDATLMSSEALLLHGPNGSGKSSMLRILAGLVRPAAGRILINGTDASLDALHMTTLLAGHALALKSALSVRDNLAFWADCLGGSRARIAPALEMLALEPLAPLPLAMLSAGQQRRTSLARLLVTERPLWLLDEPTTALDQDSIERIEAMIRDHLAAGGMAIVATHLPLAIPARRIDLRDHAPDHVSDLVSAGAFG